MKRIFKHGTREKVQGAGQKGQGEQRGKTSFFFLLYFPAIIILSSCSDWLNLEPEDGVIRERFWKTKEETFSALMGCYASLMEDDMVNRYFIWGEIRADMTELTSLTNEQLIAINNGEIVPSNPFTTWNYFYRTINQCNTVLELGKLAQEKDLSFSEKLLKQYEAEAVCIRSLAYFYLLRTFRDVPYTTQASIYDNQPFSIPATKQADIVDSLIVALKNVENEIPYSHTGLASSKGRFNTWSLKTLLADIYLWKGDYDNCIEQCSQVINSGQYSLFPVSREQVLIDGRTAGTSDTVYIAGESDASLLFDQMYVQGNCVESIFELQFGTDKENVLVSAFIPGSTTIQAKMENFTTEYFVSSSLARDWRDIRNDGIAQKQGYIWKWIGLSREDATYRESGNRFCNWIFYRLADVILMKAEALTQKAILENNNQNLLQEAKALLMQIRSRANAPESTDLLYKQTGDIDAKTLEEFILNERAREFAFEGKRWFDVLRHAKRDNYSPENLNYLLRMAILAAPPEKAYSLQNKWQNNQGSHYLPIYFEELKTNKNLVQNTFYQQ
ncbi:MAG: RagB/SusD family nutrient uptake outer membrane protein [Dysgonamonadaceae bacterium]|jgi:hypothetical protein|nr:RagB/SusD family nutrient uptake outer membrane protein [Dysgonamonadaceae bacterium]